MTKWTRWTWRTSGLLLLVAIFAVVDRGWVSPEAVTAVATAALVIVTFTYVRLTARTAEAAEAAASSSQESAKEARRTASAAARSLLLDRCPLAVPEQYVENNDDGIPGGTLVVRNEGTTPAYDLDARLVLHMGPDTLRPLPLKSLPGKLDPDGTFRPRFRSEDLGGEDPHGLVPEQTGQPLTLRTEFTAGTGQRFRIDHTFHHADTPTMVLFVRTGPEADQVEQLLDVSQLLGNRPPE